MEKILFKKYILLIKLAKTKTCWWELDRKNLQIGSDNLVSLKRLYFRSIKAYAYRLIIGRLNITLGKIK